MLRRLDELRLGHGAALGEARRVENAECFVVDAVEDRIGEDARDCGGDHEAVTAEAGGDVDVLVDAAEDRLMVGGDVVLAVDEQRRARRR